MLIVVAPYWNILDYKICKKFDNKMFDDVSVVSTNKAPLHGRFRNKLVHFIKHNYFSSLNKRAGLLNAKLFPSVW
jgi:hypothetical protein